ncbi:MAG: hypothetical protein NTU48_04805 [Legionellales bacterium]|nr:hypothetical protein [Legionellales bacterium]
MSVINETLNNLKQTKKRSPASNAFYDKTLKTEENSGVKKAHMIPIGFAVLVGALFYLSQMYAPKWMQHHPDVAQAGSENQQATLQKQLVVTEDVDAQKMYYRAMALLNEGNEEQAAQKLQDIMARHPGFAPAKQAYGMLAAH